MKNKKILIAIVIISLFVELAAGLLILVPIAGFILYPFVSGLAVILNIISFSFSKEYKKIRIISGVLAVILMLTIIIFVMCMLMFLSGI